MSAPLAWRLAAPGPGYVSGAVFVSRTTGHRGVSWRAVRNGNAARGAVSIGNAARGAVRRSDDGAMQRRPALHSPDRQASDSQSHGQTGLAHRSVMIDEVMAGLRIQPGELVVDGTFGGGGHARALLAADARVLALDRDKEAIRAGRALVDEWGGQLVLKHDCFSRFADHLGTLAPGAGKPGPGGGGTIDALVLDLGVSSHQIDTPQRGFSFRSDGPLDMRMGDSKGRGGPDAAFALATLPQATLARIIHEFGEERQARRIARAIVARRAEKPLMRTSDLATLVLRVLGPGGRIHPATRSFQALRIFVNQELAELERALLGAEAHLRENGRLVVVSFHSLEDRLVKSFLARRCGKSSGVSRHLPGPGTALDAPPTFALMPRRMMRPNAGEIAANPRARSARMRIAMRTGAPQGAPATDMLYSSGPLAGIYSGLSQKWRATAS